MSLFNRLKKKKNFDRTWGKLLIKPALLPDPWCLRSFLISTAAATLDILSWPGVMPSEQMVWKRGNSKEKF